MTAPTVADGAGECTASWAARAQRLQSCLTPGSPMDCSHQAPRSMEFSSPEYWSGWPCPPPGDLPNPGIEPASPAFPALQVDSLLLSHQGS